MKKPRFPHRKIFSLVFLFCFVSIFSLLLINRSEPSVKGIITTLSSQEIIETTNQIRADHNLSPLIPDQLLSAAAQAKANHMIESGYFSHYAPDGIPPWKFIDESGYQYLFAGENLARNFSTASDLVNSWINSPAHKENLLNPNYSEIGVAVIEGPFMDQVYTTLIVQLLASPLMTNGLPNPDYFSTPPELTGHMVTSGTLKNLLEIVSLLFISIILALILSLLITQIIKAIYQKSTHPKLKLWSH